MKMIHILTAAFLFTACSNSARFEPATDGQEAGREFIRASLDGDIKKANFYLLQDNENLYIFNKWKEQYQQLSPEEKVAYRTAQIRPVKIENIGDTLVNYTFTNSYKIDDTTVLSVVKTGDFWQVDLKAIH